MPFPRTSFATLYARRVPYLAQWATGIAVVFGWPHAVISYSNKANNVPPINDVYF